MSATKDPPDEWQYCPSLAKMTMTAVGPSGVVLTMEYPPDEAAALDGRRKVLSLALSRQQMETIGEALVRGAAHLGASAVAGHA
ncbi:hypothetical protein VQH23_16415 [Pararoseomonas sp. SCSIO 73927]|uniref:hypothetical protein n=1 Tax=Pararoseomonas sp. SCSIO 73927 TaxID=3114537 RepID=UPI0030CBA4DE